MRVAIVAPCHIPPSKAWIAALAAEATEGKADVIIVDDSDGNLGPLPPEWDVYDYRRQEEFLGELYPEFARLFHKGSACRVFGHLVALSKGYGAVIGLDSDCIVRTNFVKTHVQFLNEPYGGGWFNPLGTPWHSRGYPYSQRNWPIVANMGLWENVLDINGKDRMPTEPISVKIAGSSVPVAPFPFSGMNFALTKEAIPGFLFLPNFKDPRQNADFRRIDDIWGGYIFQRMMRVRHESAMVGYPFVYHDTVVVAEEDAIEEDAMYRFEDSFVESVDRIFNNANFRKESSYLDMMRAVMFEWPTEAGRSFDALEGPLYWWTQAIEKYA